jgi:HEAT repeat protein
MPSNFSCPRCHTPLNLSQAGPGGGTAACPRCGAAEVTPGPCQAAPAEAPWWVASAPVPLPGEAAHGDRPADEAPWWATPPVSLPAAPPPPVAAAPPPPARRSWALAGVCLAVAVLLAAGVGLVFLCFPGHEPPASPLAQASSASPEAQPAAAAPAPPKKGAGPSESIPPPKAEPPAPAGRPEAPERVAGPVPEPPAPPERPKGAGRDEGERTETASSPTKSPDEDPPELPEGAAPLVWRLASARKAERLQGAALLGRYGGAAKAAAPTLAYTMRADPDAAVANEAAAALARIGRAGVPYLTAALRDRAAAVRQRAAAALAVVGPEGRSAAAALLDALKDDSGAVRAVAAHALGEVGGHPDQTVPALCRALRDPAAEVRKQARLALVNLGAAAVPALRAALKAEDTGARRDAAQVLGQLGADAKAAAPDLALLLKDDQAEVRAAAAGALAALGKEAQAAIPTLLEAMRQEKRFEVQQQLFQALTLVGSRDLPGFLKAVREVDKGGKWATAFRLPQFGERAEDAVKPLLKLLTDPDPGKRLGAAISLGKVGLLSDQTVPALAKAMDDPSPPVRAAAAVSLARLAPGHERAAEVKLAASFKAMDKMMVALAQQQLLFGRRADAQVRRADAQAALGGVPRPLNRVAVLDPVIQAQYDQLLTMYLLVATPECPQSKIWSGVIGLNRNKAHEDALRRQVDALPPEAAPALVRAINKAAYFNLGFC